jgi:uncharacterized membrane protein YeaQ/YmgE (transglycosylase-associated protein family)
LSTATGGEAPPDVTIEGTTERRRFGPMRSELRAFLELFAVAGLAIVQPALDVLSNNTEVLVSKKATAAQTIVVVAALVIGPPFVAWVLEVLSGLAFPAARRYVHAVLVAVFAGVFVEEVVKHATSLEPLPLVIIGIVGALVAALLVLRVEASRTFLRFLALAPVAFVVLFLFASPATSAVMSDGPGKAADVEIHRPKRVVMIVMDEFPLQTLLDGQGKIDAALYPNFAELAQTSTWYRNDTTVAPFTELAVPAIATGQYPSKADAVPTSVDYPDTIFRLLGGTYDMNVHEQDFVRLCPNKLCPAAASPSFGGNVKAVGEEVVDLWRKFAAPERTRADFVPANSEVPAMRTARQFLSSLRPSDQPTLDYVHILLPHQPWRFNQALQDTGFTTMNSGAPYGIWASDEAAAVGHMRHRMSTQAADTFIGQTIRKLKRIGAWDDSVVVVTADHGIAFEAGQPTRGATNANVHEILWTPLFIKAPAQTSGVTDDRPMQSIDVVPTIAKMIDARIPWNVDGVAAQGAPRKEFPRRLYQWSPLGLKVSGELKVDPPNYLSFPARPNQAKVLDAEPAAQDGPPDLRIYRLGRYGALVGQPVAPLQHDEPGGPATIYVQDPGAYTNIEPTAKRIPWSFIEGYVKNLAKPTQVAFAANGVIVGLSEAAPLPPSKNGYYSASLAPTLFRSGANELTAYAVTGPPSQPRLSQIPVGGIQASTH